MFSRRGADRASEMADVQYREAVQQIRELCRYLRFIHASEEHLQHRVMNYIEAPIALPLFLDNEAMMQPRRKMLISPLFDKFDRACNSFPPHSAPLLLTVLFLLLIEIPIAVASHLS